MIYTKDFVSIPTLFWENKVFNFSHAQPPGKYFGEKAQNKPAKGCF